MDEGNPQSVEEINTNCVELYMQMNDQVEDLLGKPKHNTLMGQVEDLLGKPKHEMLTDYQIPTNTIQMGQLEDLWQSQSMKCSQLKAAWLKTIKSQRTNTKNHYCIFLFLIIDLATVIFRLLNAIKVKTYHFSKASLLTLVFSISRLETVPSYAPMTLQEIGR